MCVCIVSCAHVCSSAYAGLCKGQQKFSIFLLLKHWDGRCTLLYLDKTKSPFAYTVSPLHTELPHVPAFYKVPFSPRHVREMFNPISVFHTRGFLRTIFLFHWAIPLRENLQQLLTVLPQPRANAKFLSILACGFPSQMVPFAPHPPFTSVLLSVVCYLIELFS